MFTVAAFLESFIVHACPCIYVQQKASLFLSFTSFPLFQEFPRKIEEFEEGELMKMQGWLKITLAAVSSGILVSLLIMVVRRACCPGRRRRGDRLEERRGSEIVEDVQAGGGVSQLHHVSLHHLDRNGTKKTNYYVFRRGPSTKPFFSWADHPSLVTDAVENGWSQFGFTAYTPSPSVRSARALLGPCGTGDHGDQTAVKISWEVSPGSADFMQKIQFRCNSDILKRITSSRHNFTAMGAPVSSAIKTSLPLPGPPLGTSSFPQEAYFEITVLPCDDQEDSRRSQEDKIKLIQDDINAKTVKNRALQESSEDGKENRNHVALSVGLSGSGSLPLKLPGSYPSSIGFNSNGSVCLDGKKHHRTSCLYISQKQTIADMLSYTSVSSMYDFLNVGFFYVFRDDLSE